MNQKEEQEAQQVETTPDTESSGDNGMKTPPASILKVSTASTEESDATFSYQGGFVPPATKHVVIDASVAAIPHRAMWSCFRLTQIDFAQAGTLTTLGEHSFSSCSSLETISLPKTLTCINDCAFRYCRSLREFTMPDSVVTLGERVFEDCEALSIVNLSQQLQTIRPYTFLNCKALQTIQLPDAITTIRQGAFENCHTLQTVQLSSNLQRIEQKAFCACYELEQLDGFRSGIYLGENALGATEITASRVSEPSLQRLDGISDTLPPAFDHVTEYLYHGNGKVADKPTDFAVRVEASCIVGRNQDGTLLEVLNSFIPLQAFDNCQHLVHVHLPSSISSIGDFAFKNCGTLESLTIPDRVVSIGEGAFQCCKRLETLTLPHSVTQLGASVFSECSSLKTISLSRNLTSISPRCFSMCQSLENVEIPENECLTTIGDSAFQQCTSLCVFDIPDTVTTVGPGAFGNCASLETIRIPPSVRTLGLFAFAGCRSLVSIQMPQRDTVGVLPGLNRSTPLVIANGAFSGCGSLSTIEIPELPLALWPLLLKQFHSRRGNFYRIGMTPTGAKTSAFTFLQSYIYQVFEDLPMIQGEGRWVAETEQTSNGGTSLKKSRSMAISLH